jgi:formylglycine-generating enzyme required for sulfatase activity
MSNVLFKKWEGKMKKQLTIIPLVILLCFIFSSPQGEEDSNVLEGFVFVESGTFQMGSNDGNSDEKPVHSVTVSDFYMGKYEVTFNEYDAFCNATGKDNLNDYGMGRGSRPVISVSWFDAVEYCNWRSRKENLTSCYTINGNKVTCNFSANGYRLPTEAEWEFAAKGGNQSKGYKYSGSNNVGDVGWYGSNSGSGTHPVGQKQANELGLYDMSGNVWEWCWDWYDSNYYSSSPSTNPKGASSGKYRVLRGGSWHDDDVGRLRTAARERDVPADRSNGYDFRLSRTH